MTVPTLVSDISEITPAESIVPATVVVPTTTTPAEPVAEVQRKIPITIVTGYLGSGKSTLLERIGKTSNKRLAIILNEFGDSAVIEKSVTIKDQHEAVQEWLDLGNGCLCCTVKDNGVIAIEQLIERLGDKIDYILLETTGVADPAPIAQMFWLDEGLASRIYIDGVVTVVDAQHIITCLDDVGGHWDGEESAGKMATDGITTAHLQIAMADTVLINKVDVVSEEQVEAVRRRVEAINLATPIHTSSFGDILLLKILDLHAFENQLQPQPQRATYHDARIATRSIDFPFFTRALQFKGLESFLQYILWDEEVECEVHRLKGLITLAGENPVTKVIQGVRKTYDIIDDAQLLDGVECNKLVFIGKDLDTELLTMHLNRFVI